MRLYTIKEITEIVNRTEPTIYAYMRKDADFFNSHRITQKKGCYLYDELAVERLKNNYAVSNGVENGISQNEDGEILQHAAPVDMRENDAIKAELAELKAKYAELEARFQAAEAERKQLLEQNGNLLLLLSQEKAEKQKLLPPPRISERIKNLFRKPPTDN